MHRSLLMYGLGFVAFWDTVTTIYGTRLIFGPGVIQIGISILFGVMLSIYLIYTIPIIKNPSTELIPVGAKVLWFIAVLYDAFTAFKGNFDLVLGNVGGEERIILAIGLTLFICSAPIGLSKLIFPSDSD